MHCLNQIFTGRTEWPPGRLQFRCAVLMLAAILYLPQAAVYAQPMQEADENSLRAALVLNISRFVTGPEAWTSGEDNFFHIGVFGSREVIDAFEPLSGKMVGGRTVKIHPLSKRPQTWAYHAIYVGPEPPKNTGNWLKKCTNPHVLLIIEPSKASDLRGIIQITRVDERFTLTVFRQRANRAGLSISAQLLRLASVVDEES